MSFKGIFRDLMLKRLPFILLAIMCTASFTQQLIPVEAKSFIYAFSLSIKNLIVFLLPFLIFFLLFKTASQLAKGATRLLLIILACVILSNFTTTFTSFAVGSLVHKLNIHLQIPEKIEELNALWSLNLPTLFSNSLALFAGTLLGILSTFSKGLWVEKLKTCSQVIISLLIKFFVYAIPFFITGFIIKLAHDQILISIFKEYALIFSLVAASQIFYIGLLYFFINKLDLKETVCSIKNMLPAAFVGFSAMSSAAALPLTILAVEKNARNKDMAKSCIPATVNIHLIGDCLAIPIFAFAVLKNFSCPCPSLLQYSLFALFFVLAKFSVAAIPGGGIIVMLPILESHLGFSSDMLSLITALYILFDPVITLSNVIGNGALAQGVDHLYSRLFKPKIPAT